MSELSAMQGLKNLVKAPLFQAPELSVIEDSAALFFAYLDETDSSVDTAANAAVSIALTDLIAVVNNHPAELTYNDVISLFERAVDNLKNNLIDYITEKLAEDDT